MADRQQQHVINTIIGEGKRRRLPPEAILSALETGSVETRFRNLPGGDASSEGWRQEQRKYYANPRNVKASVNRYYDEWLADAKGRGLDIGEQAQAVQQSAFPDRYETREGVARRLLRRYNRTGGSRSQSATSTTTRRIPGVDNSGLRRDLKLQYLAESDSNPDALLNLGLGLRNAADVPGSVTTTFRNGGHAKGTGNGTPIDQMLKRAQGWERAKVPYQWGGGHGSIAKPGQPVDCSGYVSAILGLKTPLVSGQLMSWGKPGPGRNITVYASETHTFIRIGSKWFGTSKSNPGGGAGRISPPSREYLSRFVARHPN